MHADPKEEQGGHSPPRSEFVHWLEDVGQDDVAEVGGKNASLGEMLRALSEEGVRVPSGFATTASAYRRFLEVNELEAKIKERLESMDRGESELAQVGKSIRRLFRKAEFPEDIRTSVEEAYAQLSEQYDENEVDVAARSSATAEDLPEASFAGQQESFLNVTGADDLLDACRECYASLFTDRAIAYREEQGFDHLDVALSVGVQKMVRSDRAGAGVMFSIDTETGFPDVVVIDAAWGLGESVVQGQVTPDEYRVFKPPLKQKGFEPIIEKALGDKTKKIVYGAGNGQAVKTVNVRKRDRRRYVLTDEEILKLARWAVVVEEHYEKPMDMEWAKDGDSGELYLVQARPETVQTQREAQSLRTYTLKERGEELVTGLAIGEAIAAGKVRAVKSPDEMDRFEDGDILVTGMTDPDWVPIMKRAGGIITDHGGRTSHAAIVSRELGLPAIVGTGDATDTLNDDDEITLSCAEGDQGKVYEGILEFETEELDLEDLPKIETRVMLNMASPTAALRWWRLPARGVGLARMEFIINNVIKAHPLALLHHDELKDKDARRAIRDLTRDYDDPSEFFIENLSRGIATIAASQYPEPVIVRMSDFKTNEYADLIGGKRYEPDEENPMLGLRGASRYYSERYREGFALECRALRRVREVLGLDNVVIMIPFCRTLKEADRVLETLAENGLKRGENGLEIYVMVEIPSNVILAEEFAERFDGFSIGSNDLTQLILGVDRDSAELRELFDERDPAVKKAIADLIERARRAGTKVGICGQAPSDYPEFAAFLVEAGIDSISLNPDSVIKVIRKVAEVEARRSS